MAKAVDRAYLDKITLSMGVGLPKSLSGYELRLKAFVEGEQTC